MLQESGSCHVRELKQSVVALTVQLEKKACPASQRNSSSSLKCEMRSLASPVNARHKSIPCLSRGISVVLNHLSQCAAVVAPGLLRLTSVPLWERALVNALPRFAERETVTTTTTPHRRHGRRWAVVAGVPVVPLVLLILIPPIPQVVWLTRCIHEWHRRRRSLGISISCLR